jgi:L-serine dehydratase
LEKLPPSIFNDVIGPVMRGPSSSHTAASVRIGRLLRQFYSGRIKKAVFEFEPQGSLATTYSSQGSDIGLVGGLLGMDTADPRLTEALEIAPEEGLAVEFKIIAYPANHPNTYKVLIVDDEGREDRFIFVSSGGGMIELQEINGSAVVIKGDYYETLLFFENEAGKHQVEALEELKSGLAAADEIMISNTSDHYLIDIKSNKPLPEDDLAALFTKSSKPVRVVRLKPVLPVKSRKEIKVPFLNAAEITESDLYRQKSLADLAICYESTRSGLNEATVVEMARYLVGVMRGAVEEGLAGTDYEDRILGPQAAKLSEFSGRLVGGNLNRRVITYITAIMETKSAMGVIVAAPTAGSCAGLPGTLLAVADELSVTSEEIARGLMAAGLIGVFIAAHSTFAAEECGCQAECGSGSGMAAAALVQLADGSSQQALAAASLALQNTIGLACDPVANRVEVPCLGKNILGGLNAIASADMALAGFDQVIPLDQTIAAQDQIGRLMPSSICCTGKAGLSVTTASAAVAKKLAENKK